MPRVVLIHNTWISAPNGANTVIRHILESKKLFESAGLDFSAITYETVTGSYYVSPKNSLKSKVRFIIKKALVKISQYVSFAAQKIIELAEFAPARKVVSYYLNNSNKDDILFFHSVFTCYEYLKLSKKKKKIVLVMHTNGDTFKMHRIYYKTLEKSRYYQVLLEIERFTISNVDAICFVADAARQNFLSLHPYVEPEKVFTVHNGVPIIPEVNNRQRNKTIELCCVASISNRKGQQYIIDAIKMFSEDSIPDIHITFVGDGDFRSQLERLVSSNKVLDKIVSFVGTTNNVDLYLNKSDVFILASEDEGLPMAIIEAMRSSLPIIATPVGGIPELLIPNHNGVFINPSAMSIYELFKEIQNYDWIEFGKKSRNLFLENFTIEKMVNKYINILSSLK